MPEKKKNRFFPILGIVIITLLILIILLPVLLKDQIASKALEIANENVNAEIAIGKVNLSLFKSFPDLQFSMSGLKVSGKGAHAETNLAEIKNISLDIDLKSALKKEINLNSILIEEPKINARILSDGSANWDIAKNQPAKEEKPKEEKEPSEPGDLGITLKSFVINNASISFIDDAQKMSVSLDDLDIGLQGDFSAQTTTMNLQTNIDKINFEQNGVRLARDMSLEFLAAIGIDLTNMTFSFQENTLKLNELEFGFDGSIGMNDDGSMDTDLTFKAKQTDFKTLLSFVPAVYMQDFEELQTDGSLKFEGYAKGRLIEDQLPGFGLNLEVENASIQYPDLPAAIHDINIEVKINNPGGDADNTNILVQRFELQAADNPVSASLSVTSPVSDPSIAADIDMNVNLSTLKTVIPMEGMTLSGMIDADVKLNTRMSHIENEDYDKVKLQGGVNLTNFIMKSAEINQDVKITKAELAFSPQYVRLKKFNAMIADTDLSLSGKVENFIPFALQNKTLTGELNVSSKLINANKLMTLSGDKQPASQANTQAAKAPASTPQSVVIPDNIQLDLNCELSKLLFDKMEITNLSGKFKLQDAIADLNNLRFDIFKGGIRVTGKFNGREDEPAKTEATLKLWKLDIHDAFKSIAVLQKTMPVLDYSSGKVSGNVELAAVLDEAMQPVLESINSEGNLNTTAIKIENSPVLNQIADNLKNPKLKKISLSPADISYVMTNGNLKISPFKVSFMNSSSEIEGTVSANQQMNITIDTQLSLKDLGDDARKQINDLVTQINKAGFQAETPEYLDVPVTITGSVTEPKVGIDWRTGFSKLLDNLKGQLQKQLQDKVIEEGKEKLEEKAGDLIKGLFK